MSGTKSLSALGSWRWLPDLLQNSELDPVSSHYSDRVVRVLVLVGNLVTYYPEHVQGFCMIRYQLSGSGHGTTGQDKASQRRVDLFCPSWKPDLFIPVSGSGSGSVRASADGLFL